MGKNLSQQLGLNKWQNKQKKHVTVEERDVTDLLVYLCDAVGDNVATFCETVFYDT